MNQTYLINRPWADKFIDDQTRLIRTQGAQLITVRQATKTEDMQQAFDNVFEIDGLRLWPVRVRRPDCSFRDLTIRTTDRWADEYDKIMDGFGDAYLYGWTTLDSEERCRLAEWVIIDLDKFRSDKGWIESTRKLGHNRGNGDNNFWSWHWQSLDERGLVLASKMAAYQSRLF